MTERPSIEELRRWSAIHPMGWDEFDDEQGGFYGKSHYPEPPDVICTKQDTSYGLGWRPDDEKTGQIWMVIEKMQEKGFYVEIRNYDVDDEYRISFYTDDTIFYEDAVARACDKYPCVAILRAAWAAWQEGKDV